MSLKDMFKKKKKESVIEDVESSTGNNDNWNTNEDVTKESGTLNFKTSDSKDATEEYENELNNLYQQENKISSMKASVDEENDEHHDLIGGLATMENDEHQNESFLTDNLDNNKIEKKSKKNFSFNFFKKKKEIILNTETSDFERKTITINSDSDEEIISEGSKTGASISSSTESIDKKQKRIPIIGKYSIKGQYLFALTILSLSLISIFGGILASKQSEDIQTEGSKLITKVTSDYKSFGFSLNGAIIGRNGEWDKTFSSWSDLTKNYEKLKGYNTNFSNKTKESTVILEKEIELEMASIKKNLNLVKAEEDLIKNTALRVNFITTEADRLADLTDRLGIVYVQLGATKNEMANIYFIKGALKTISSNVSTLYLAENVPEETIGALRKARADVRGALKDLYYGDKNKGINAINLESNYNTYQKLAENWVKFADVLDTTSNRASQIVAVHKVSSISAISLAKIDVALSKIANIYASENYTTSSIGYVFLSFGILFLLLSLILILLIYNTERENRVLLEKFENSKNQSSILKLLNEMMPLQEGDLTHKTTVSEEITGAIADSINATVDSLSTLVKKITDTSFSMREKANQVNQISLGLLKSAEEQSVSMTETGESVNDISKAIKDISTQTLSSAKSAKESASMSATGAEQVFASIETMQKINQNMNETVKLMSKVGESSKQISEIVSLLSDITEETNILSLNATVQATKAGESGKGFKIVADSIQELADKAAEATRRVGALISAVQTDIQSVSDSVERTTSEVEKGVNLSESAGEVLSVIKNVSENLSNIVQKVSEDALVHAKASEQISKNVEKIVEVTKQSKTATEKTANSIAEITVLSNELGESVQSFKV